jgi:hypothetical protein
MPTDQRRLEDGQSAQNAAVQPGKSRFGFAVGTAAQFSIAEIGVLFPRLFRLILRFFPRY